MWSPAVHMESNRVQIIFSWNKTHRGTSPGNLMIIEGIDWEINSYLWEVQNLPEKWQLLDWSRVTLIERPSSWKHVYKWLRDLSLVLDWSRSMTSIGYKAIWLWSVFGTNLVLKFEDQDQAQDEDDVWVLVTYWRSFGRRKWLK